MYVCFCVSCECVLSVESLIPIVNRLKEKTLLLLNSSSSTLLSNYRRLMLFSFQSYRLLPWVPGCLTDPVTVAVITDQFGSFCVQKLIVLSFDASSSQSGLKMDLICHSRADPDWKWSASNVPVGEEQKMVLLLLLLLPLNSFCCLRWYLSYLVYRCFDCNLL